MFSWFEGKVGKFIEPESRSMYIAGEAVKEKSLQGTKNPHISVRVLKLVVWAGIEPATHGFSVHCSTN